MSEKLKYISIKTPGNACGEGGKNPVVQRLKLDMKQFNHNLPTPTQIKRWGTGRDRHECVWSHSEHERCPVTNGKEVVWVQVNQLWRLYFFPTFYFFYDDLFSFYTDTIQSKSQSHFKIFNRLSQTLQFPQNIGWTVISYIPYMYVLFIEYHCK